MKKILSIGLILASLNANTLSLDNSNLKGNKTIYFNNNSQIKVTPYNRTLILNNHRINLEIKNYQRLQNKEITKLLGLKPKITKNEFDEKIVTYPSIPYFQLNSVISDMMLNQNLDGLNKFLVQDNNIIYYVKLKRNTINIYDKLKNKNVKATKIYLKILKTIKNHKLIKSPYNTLFKVVNYNGNILQMKLKNKDFNLQKVYNRYVDIYKQKKATLETEVTKEYDVADNLTSIFVLDNNYNQYRLKFNRYLNPQNKNIINSDIEASNKIFKPNAPLDMQYSFISLSFNVPHQLLFELQGIFKEDNNVIYKFVNSPKQRYASVIYKNNQNKIDKLDYFNGDKSYYTFSNFLNLLEWMRYNKKPNISIMMFFDNIKPVNYDISITDTNFIIKKGSEIAFRGSFNKYGYVKEINFNNKKLMLEDLYSTKTKQNREYLKSFKINHHIIEIKDK